MVPLYNIYHDPPNSNIIRWLDTPWPQNNSPAIHPYTKIVPNQLKDVSVYLVPRLKCLKESDYFSN